jgi:hypothetical protein
MDFSFAQSKSPLPSVNLLPKEVIKCPEAVEKRNAVE